MTVKDAQISPTLAELQQQMKACISAKGQGNDFNQFAELIRGDGFKSTDRLSIHQNNIRLSLMDSIVDSFPMSTAFIGEDFMRQVVREFIYTQKPTDPRLSEYGALFIPFWQSHSQTQDYAFVADLMRVEQALEKMQELEFMAPLGPEGWQVFAEAGEDIDNLYFTMSRSYTVIESNWPIMDLWQLIHGEISEDEIDMSEGGQTVCAINKDGNVYLYLLTSITAIFICAIEKAAGNFLAALETCQNAMENDLDVASLLQEVAEIGLLTGVRIEKSYTIDEN